MSILDSIRKLVPASARENWYRYGGAAIVLLASWGYIDTTVVAQWSALVLGVITLLFAALHSTSSVRTALYLLLVAVQGVAGGVFGILNGQQWGAIVTLAGLVLGVATAAAKTPTPVEFQGIWVRGSR
ncbi:hypothetical protein [Rhodococcus sp. IEGM 1379]|uniref:phage holin n=1 Tax=Rhodococcus sp. IEGM 1379 TaxID=3047086 RepID=UPI0024B74EB0|nr:hypothetical protein [Rhodococcus sp. IEGM 1379]MDI9914338.1 hypothetical protein [Rhodococcus sp. IEGM 1379]